jgi:peptidoglycan/xylan/chitin deacetylase (PgdA/CDA1 family)
MSTQPSDHSAAGRRPRHSADPAPHAAPEDSFPSRPGRPESLADVTAPPRSAAIWSDAAWSDERPPAETAPAQRRPDEEQTSEEWLADLRPDSTQTTKEWLAGLQPETTQASRDWLAARRPAGTGPADTLLSDFLPAGAHVGRRRRAETEPVVESHPADAEIEAARAAAARLTAGPAQPAGPSRSERRRQERDKANPGATGRPRPQWDPAGPQTANSYAAHSHASSRVERRRQERIAARHNGKHTAARGRHARPADPLDITVRPATLTGGEPAGRRPVTGARRAPGTLPLESWLLVGKTRQQIVLASLIAAGLALVMIPAAQRDEPVSPVNAAGQAAVTTRPAEKAKAEPPATAAKPKQKAEAAEKDRPATRKPPTTGVPAANGKAEPTEPVVTVPAGDGPFQSLRTTGTSTVALTFDDGPDPVQTPKILAMLDQYDVQATFCVVGEQVEKHPDIVRQIVAAGHILCNHTWDHSLTIGKDEPERIEADLARTNKAIRDAVPDAKIPFFRAPGGNFSDRLVQVAYQSGMTSLYWQVDPRDWDHDRNADDETHVAKVVEQVRATVKPGSIVLSHDFGQPDTITAYEELLPWLAGNFQLGTPPVS